MRFVAVLAEARKDWNTRVRRVDAYMFYDVLGADGLFFGDAARGPAT